MPRTPLKTYLFLDTETNGLPRGNFLGMLVQPEIVQIAWMLTTERGRVISEESHIVRPPFKCKRNWSKEAEALHGISLQKALEEGEDEESVLLKFVEAAQQADLVICHNLCFDFAVIDAALRAYRIEFRMTNCKQKDTMTWPLRIPGLPWHESKQYPKLSALHQYIFHKEIENAHDALADVRAVKRCFFALKKIEKGEPVEMFWPSEEWEEAEVPEGGIELKICSDELYQDIVGNLDYQLHMLEHPDKPLPERLQKYAPVEPDPYEGYDYYNGCRIRIAEPIDGKILSDGHTLIMPSEYGDIEMSFECTYAYIGPGSPFIAFAHVRFLNCPYRLRYTSYDSGEMELWESPSYKDIREIMIEQINECIL